MSVYLKIALWVFLASALVALANLMAIRAFPESWGGPTSVGVGAVQLLAYTGAVVSVGFFIAAIVEWRKKRSGDG